MTRLALTLLFTFLAFETSARECLSYLGRVNVSGTLVRKAYGGAPAFEESKRKTDVYYLLRLTPPACVDARPRDADGIDVAVSRLNEMQLVFDSDEEYRHFRPYLGKPRRLSGVLMGASTGWHHTPVLLINVRDETSAKAVHRGR